MKRILLVVDSENWTLGNIAKQLKKNLSNYFEIDIITLEMFNDSLVKVLILSKKYDLTHFLWRGQLLWLDDSNSRWYIETLGLDYDYFVKEYVKNNIITTTICDHLFLTPNEIEKTKYILSIVKDYIVINEKLLNIYKNIEGIKKPYGIIHDGVDLTHFKPNNKKKTNNKICLGWAGNSKFTDSENDDDLKGVNKIIKPAINELIKENYNIEIKIADRNTNYIPYEKMPDYYNDIDVYICSSKTEGTPAPVLEAMACGKIVISTDVGVVPEVFGKLQKKYMMKERSKEELKEKIKEVISNSNNNIAEENISRIKNYDWTKISLDYKKFFEYSLKKNNKEDSK